MPVCTEALGRPPPQNSGHLGALPSLAAGNTARSIDRSGEAPFFAGFSIPTARRPDFPKAPWPAPLFFPSQLTSQFKIKHVDNFLILNNLEFMSW